MCEFEAVVVVVVRWLVVYRVAIRIPQRTFGVILLVLSESVQCWSIIVEWEVVLVPAASRVKLS